MRRNSASANPQRRVRATANAALKGLREDIVFRRFDRRQHEEAGVAPTRHPIPCGQVDPTLFHRQVQSGSETLLCSG